jgi:uncharacterized RDD family membrane protein YckC
MSAQPAGWYPNQQGQMQWWDGNAWGQVQQQAATMPPPPAAPMGGYGAAPAVAYGGGYNANPMPVAVQQGAQLSSWGARVGAALIDTVFILFTIGIGWIVNWFLMARQGEKNGMTLGKQVVGQRVVKEDGTPVDIGFALLREFVVRFLLIGVVGGLFFFPGILDLLWPLWDERNQTLHDKIVKSYVVDA